MEIETPTGEAGSVPASNAAIETPAPVVPAVETGSAPATETPVTPAVEAGSAPAAEPGPPSAVDELRAQRKRRQEAEREAAYWRGVAEAGGKKPEVPAATPADPYAAPPVRPPLEPFEGDIARFEEADRRWVINQAKYEMAQEFRTATQAEARRTAQQTAEQQFQARIATAAEEDPQILDILNDPTLPLSEAMAPTIKESEAAPQLLRWLSQNRKEAFRIAQLNPLAAARELGKIEAQLALVPKPEPPRQVSAAPEPIRIVSPVSSATIDEDNLSMAEYHRRETLRMLGKAP